MVGMLRAALVGMAFALTSTGLHAQVAAPKGVSAQETKDAEIVMAAMSGGPDAIQRLAPDLMAMLARAPTPYPMREIRDGLTIIRTAPSAEGQPPSTGGAAAPDPKTEGEVAYVLDTYPLAAFVLGSYAIEARRPEAAIMWLDKGLALQPTLLHLVTEKAAALNMLGRLPESVALLDTALADPQQARDLTGRARALRAKGWALIELKRLDEAEASYRESLRLEPGHCTALTELGYIAQMRGTPKAPGAPAQVVTSDQARQGCHVT